MTVTETIRLLNAQMEDYTRLKKSNIPSERKIFETTLCLARTIKDQTLPPAEICAELRGLSIRAQGVSPALAAYQNMIADEFQTLQQ